MMPPTQMDMFPVRVLVESVRPQRCLSCAHDGCQLLDTFAIVSGQTQLGQLVDTVLSALGLPHLIQDSRGLIQINNWKPLSFETITDNKEEPVANLFKEISSNIVLKILTKHPSTDPHNSSQCIMSIKQRLLKIAMEKQPHLLTTMDNHDIKETIQQLISGEDEVSYNLSTDTITAINEWLDQISNESANHKNTIQATRGFNVIEVAKLERWFLSEQNPQRPKLLSYMNTLNNSPYRRSGSKVTYQQICNWFTNQRAFLRKQQQIAQNLQQHTLNGNGNGFAAMAVNEFQQLRNAFTSANSNGVTNTDVQMTEASSSNSVTTTNSTFLNTPALGLNTSGGGSPTTVGSTTASTAVSAAGSTAGATEIPIATLPVDIASKFGASNGCNALLNGSRHHIDGERIDGGSESPNGNDDTSVQSPSERNAYDMDVKESGASSPAEMTIDVNAMSPSSNSLGNQTVGDLFNVFPNGTNNTDGLNGGQITPVAAAAAAAAMFGLTAGDNNAGQNVSDFSRQNGVNGAQNNQLMAAFSSLMPSLLGNGSPFSSNSNFLNGNAMTSMPPQSNSPISSTNSSHNNGMSGFGGSLKATSSFFKDDNLIKQEASINNNNNTPNNNNNNTARSRLMFDPLSELPVLERWFEENPHPGCLQIEQYTDKLNSCQYRQNYPPISTHNVKIWFKNRRAKCKRLNLSGNPADAQPKSTALSV